MVREIKFRAWDGYKMYEPCIWIGKEYLPRTDSFIELHNCMQYSGLKDKNGKEIYDQDILSLWCQADPNDFEMKALVYWCSDQYGWRLKCFHPSGSTTDESLAEVAGEPKFIEVIGNTQQTPELI